MKQHLPSPGAFALAALLTCNFAAQGQHIAGQSAGRPLSPRCQRRDFGQWDGVFRRCSVGVIQTVVIPRSCK
jgi:hypothetical protein